MIDISGKTAIVTGAASGIGLGIATALAEAGANVVMADIQKDAVEQAAHGLSGTNKRVMPVRIDVTQEQSVLDALAEAERNFGKLHIACNNGGGEVGAVGHRVGNEVGVRTSASRLRVAAAFFAESDRSDAGRDADARPPSRPPLREEAWFSGCPRPDPLSLPPPLSLLTVAQARASASSSGTPRDS